MVARALQTFCVILDESLNRFVLSFPTVKQGISIALMSGMSTIWYQAERCNPGGSTKQIAESLEINPYILHLSLYLLVLGVLQAQSTTLSPYIFASGAFNLFKSPLKTSLSPWGRSSTGVNQHRSTEAEGTMLNVQLRI